MDADLSPDENLVSDDDNSNIGAHGLQYPPVPLTNFQGPLRSNPIVVQNISELAILGKFEPVNAGDVTYKVIEEYVHNSHGPPQGAGVKVHNVYNLTANDNTEATEPSAPKMNPNSTKGVKGSEHLLLWMKTTPTGIQKFAQGTDSCIALYDRICRAYTEKPSNLNVPLRQIFILCEVSLGKKLKDRNGFRVWSIVGQAPPGFDTVKGMGSLCPDWNENYYEGAVTFPCGATVKHKAYKKYEINFNEYIIFERNRIKVRFAVEVEIIPAALVLKANVGGLNNSDSDDDELLPGIGIAGSTTGQANPQPSNSSQNPTKRKSGMRGYQTTRVSNMRPLPAHQPPLSLSRNFTRTLNLGSSQPVSLQPAPTPPKKNLLDSAALQILQQLPGATPASFQTCLYKAQIITPANEVHKYIETSIQ